MLLMPINNQYLVVYHVWKPAIGSLNHNDNDHNQSSDFLYLNSWPRE